MKLAKEGDILISDQSGHLLEISFGYLTSNQIYSYDKKINATGSLIWKTNVTQNHIAIEYHMTSLLQLRLTSQCLDKYCIISNTGSGGFMLIVPLTAPPKCYMLSGNGQSKTHSRLFDFGIIDASCLAESSAICLKFVSEAQLTMCASMFVRIMKLDLHQGFIEYKAMSPKSDQFASCLSDFWSTYAYQALLSLGSRIKDRILLQDFEKICTDSHSSLSEKYPNHRCYLKLMAIYNQARKNRFFDINREYDQIPPMLPSIMLDKCIYVPRVYLTPYGIFPLQIQPMRGNRILRQNDLFGPYENFCIAMVRDIDLGQAGREFIKANERWIKDLIVANRHLCVGNRHFQFLLSSNSQLKSRTFWFHAPYNNRTAADIRLWMGDFSHETCIGRRVARMALSLTSTTPSITVNNEHWIIVKIVLS